MRMCAGCRRRDEQRALLRCVLAGDPPAVVPDVRRRGGGRGVSVHPCRECLAKAVRARAFGRAFRLSREPNAEELADWASQQYSRRAEGLLEAAVRSGHAVIGEERVREAIDARRVQLLLLAGDAAERRHRLLGSAERLGDRCVIHSDTTGLGKPFGRPSVAVVAITESEIARELQQAAHRASELAEAS